MTVFNVKVSQDDFESEVVSKNRVNIKTKNNVDIYGFENFNPVLDNAIADQHIPVTGILSVSISSVFSDIDTDRHDVVTKTAVSSDPDICGASVVDNNLILTGYKVGQTTVTITARDLFNLSVSDTLTVDVFTIFWLGVTRAIGPTGQHWVYEIRSDNGAILSSFQVTDLVAIGLRSLSSIEYDKSDGTLWFNDNQEFSSGRGGERLFHTELDGTLISETAVGVPIGGIFINNANGIALDADGSMWWVSGADDKVFNTNKEFTKLFSSFSLGTGLSDIAVSDDGTLWISDAHSTVRTVYNVDKLGNTLSSYAFSQFGDPSAKINSIGISRSDGNLWQALGNDTKSIYNTDLQGNLVATIDLSLVVSSLSSVNGLSVSS